MSKVIFPLSRPKRRRKGFSFIEVMVVIMILGLLVGIVGVSLFDSASQATVDATKTQIRGLETALDLYRLHNGRYPTTDQKLSALLERPEVGIIPKNWNGPYLRSKQMPRVLQRSASLTAILPQIITKGDNANTSAVITAVLLLKLFSSWGYFIIVSPKTSIKKIVDNAEGSLAAHVPKGSQ